MTTFTTLADAISAITATYGVDILKDGNRFCAILGDTAPGLEKERKILRRAKDEDIFCLLLDAYQADTSKRTSIISKIEYTLKSEAGFSDEWYQILMTGFSEAFSWTLPVIKTTTTAPAATVPTAPVSKKKYFTKNIARNTFSTSPKQILLPEKYNAVGEHAFDYIGLSVHVDSITIPNGYIEIQRYAFHPLKIDHFISIPDSVTEIADNAFTLEKYAYVLCSPNSYAYQYCSKHFLSNSVDGIPEKPEHIRMTKDDAGNIDSSTSTDEFLAAGLHDLIIPRGTTSVEKGAFRNRSDFDILLSDDNLKYIKKGAFAGCKSLRCAALGRGIQGIASDAFLGCTSMEMLFIDASDFHNSIRSTLGDDEWSLNISDEAFHGCTKFKYVVSNDYCKQLDDFCKVSHLTYVYDELGGKASENALPDDLHRIMLYACIRRNRLGG